MVVNVAHQQVTALVDSGSPVSFISAACLDRLRTPLQTLCVQRTPLQTLFVSVTTLSTLTSLLNTILSHFLFQTVLTQIT